MGRGVRARRRGIFRLLFPAMSESLQPPQTRLVLLLAILNSRAVLPGAPPEMQPGIRAARRLRDLLVAVLLVSFLHAIWAQFIAGTELPLQPVALRGGVEREKASVTLQLTPDMNPVQLLFRRRTDLRHSLDYSFKVRDPAGQVIETEFTGDYGIKDPPAESSARTTSMGVFDVPAAGDYVVEIEVVQRDAPTAIHDAAVGVRRDAAESHFLLTLLLWPFAAWMAVKWWQRKHGWVWDALLSGDTAAPAEADEVEVVQRDAPTVIQDPAVGVRRDAAGSHLLLTLLLWPFAPKSSPVAPAPAALARVEEGTLLDRIRTRAVFEGWSLLLTAAQVPLVGAYTMLGLIAVLGAMGGVSPASLDALMQSPVTARVAKWFFPQEHYEGFAALWAMGQAGGVLVLGFHLLLMPIRFLRSRPRRRTYGQKLKLLIKTSVIGAVLAGGVFLVTGRDFGEALKGVTIYGILLAVLFVPSAVLLAVTTKLEEIMDATYPPDDSPAN
jgi:hypothetical protein